MGTDTYREPVLIRYMFENGKSFDGALAYHVVHSDFSVQLGEDGTLILTTNEYDRGVKPRVIGFSCWNDLLAFLHTGYNKPPQRMEADASSVMDT